MSKMNRRDFTKAGLAAGALATLPMSLIRLSFADEKQDFTFAYISDSHIQHIKGKEFVRNWDQGLRRAVAEANLLVPKPDFVVFGGDLAQLGTKAELDHGAELLSGLKYKIRYVMGEHDYYLDLGAYWEKLFGPQYYSFDHKGVHFVTLNSILTTDEWTHKRWPTAKQRMEKQREWLKKDLEKVKKDTPIVVLSHSPLQKIFKNWNFWTDDAEEVQSILKPFKKVNVIYGHVHQIQYNKIGNIAFNSVMATAWPWPYPQSYIQAESHLPVLTVPMNRADPFHERDATGWQFINMNSGRVTMSYALPDNDTRVVKYNPKTDKPEDIAFQDEKKRIPPQDHY
jgi:3',5'-cyclic-AMP phosphodiesterase